MIPCAFAILSFFLSACNYSTNSVIDSSFNAGLAQATATPVPTYAPPSVSSITYLVVGGGGGGGSNGGGGGGAGGMLTGSLAVYMGSTYSVTVGAGGSPQINDFSVATTGGNSSFDSIIALGGGGGSSRDNGGNPAPGGSGGGGAGTFYSPRGSGASGTAGQGYAGADGSGDLGCNSAGGGGGGASGVGTVGSSPPGGSSIPSGFGGAGRTSNISGVLLTYAEGGTGGVTCGNAGTGGGTNASASNGAANTGGGGAGAASSSGIGIGGSGVVIISYPATFLQAQSTTSSPVHSVVNGNHIYQWTSVGAGSITF